MTIENKLLAILRCPITKQKLSVLNADKLEKLNMLIKDGKVECIDNSKLINPLSEALITENGNTIYQIIDSIPVMLEEKSIDNSHTII